MAATFKPRTMSLKQVFQQNSFVLKKKLIKKNVLTYDIIIGAGYYVVTVFACIYIYSHDVIVHMMS